MDKIVECVPNFSEGRDKVVIEKIADAVRKISRIRIRVIIVDVGISLARTVAAVPDQTIIEVADAVITATTNQVDSIPVTGCCGSSTAVAVGIPTVGVVPHGSEHHTIACRAIRIQCTIYV